MSPHLSWLVAAVCIPLTSADRASANLSFVQQVPMATAQLPGTSADPARERVLARYNLCHTLTLVCKDGELPASADVLRMASPDVLHHMIQVDESVDEWIAVLSVLYAVAFKPPSLAEVAKYLPVAHKYNMADLLAWTCTCLAEQLSTNATLNKGTDGYLLKWLQLAEQLQMDELVKVCLEHVGTLQDAHRFSIPSPLDEDLERLSAQLVLKVMRAIKPCQTEVYSVAPAVLEPPHPLGYQAHW